MGSVIMKTKTSMPIAIIGMGCLFPRATALKEFWRVLFHGEDGITDVPDTHWKVEDYYHKNPRHPDHTYCRRGGFLSTLSYDPAEFGIPPNILEATDTSQLLSLLAAKKALEHAGYGDDRQRYDSRQGDSQSNACFCVHFYALLSLVVPLLGFGDLPESSRTTQVCPDTISQAFFGLFCHR